MKFDENNYSKEELEDIQTILDEVIDNNIGHSNAVIEILRLLPDYYFTFTIDKSDDYLIFKLV